MYKLKGKKPELSYNLIIKYDSAEQLAVLESVWEEAVDKSPRTEDNGYFGLSSDGDYALVWYNYEKEYDTVLPFFDVFEEVGNELPYSAQAVYDMGREARDGLRRNLKNEKKEAVDLFFSKIILPRMEAGYTWVSFNWDILPYRGLGKLFINLTKKEFQEVMEEGGFVVRWYEDYYNANLNGDMDSVVVHISWDKGE